MKKIFQVALIPLTVSNFYVQLPMHKIKRTQQLPVKPYSVKDKEVRVFSTAENTNLQLIRNRQFNNSSKKDSLLKMK